MAKSDRAKFCWSLERPVHDALDKARVTTGVPTATVLDRLVRGWLSGKIKTADLPTVNIPVKP
jgi:hypothetical protein